MDDEINESFDELSEMDDDETLQKALLRSTFDVLLRQLDVLESAIIRNDADVENIKSQLNLVSQTLKYIQNIIYSLTINNSRTLVTINKSVDGLKK